MATQYSNKPIVTDGLVYALDFGNPKSYVSGSTTANSLKYETNLTFVTGSTSIPNSVSPVLFFTGSQWVERTGSFSVFNPNGAFTLSIVVNTKTAGTLVSQTSSLGNLVSNVSPTSSAFGFANPNYTRGIQGLSPSQLNHLTYRYSSGTLDIFYNGTLITASQATISLPTSSVVDEFYINGNNGLLNNFSGSLAAISVYNRALTINEVQNNYILSKIRYGLTQEQNYTLDENAFVFLQSAGITDPIITGSIDTFVRGLKQNNLWDKMIAIYPFVGTGSAGVNLTGSHRWNLKEPSLVTYPLSFTGSWIGSTSGSAPSGSNTNISTQVSPSTYYPFYNTQSAHISILSYDTPVSSSYLMGTGMTEDLAIFTLAGDYGTPAAAYSVRKVRTAYTGALMDVRRDLDNTTGSFGFDTLGNLDTGSLLAFVTGSEGTGSGFVARWYDQSGNNRHATQTATGSQPAIVINGSVISSGTRPSLYWKTDGFDNLQFSQINNIQTVFHISQLVETGSDQSFILGDTGIFEYHAGANSPQTWLNSQNTLLQIRSGSNFINGTSYDLTTKNRDLNRNIITLIHTEAVGTANQISIDRGNPRSWRGYIQEITLYTSSQASNREPIEYNINNYYNIYPQTSSFATSSFTIQATPTAISGAINNRLTSGIPSSGPLGLITVSRTGSNSLTIARNGVTSSFAVPASGALSTGIFLGAINNNGLALGNSPLNLSFASVGTGLTGADVNNYTRLVTNLQFDLQRASLLNYYPEPFVAYSLRLLDINYTGPAIQVRRSSDNTTLDIGFNSRGLLDTESLLNFVGTGNGYIRIWYDQSGNQNNIGRTSNANQPIIVENGSVLLEAGKPTIRFDGGQSLYNQVGAFNTSVTSPFTILHAMKATGAGTLFDGDATFEFGVRTLSDVSLDLNTSPGLRANYSNVRDQRNLFHYISNPNGNPTSMGVNTTQIASKTTFNSITFTGVSLGAAYPIYNYLLGNMQEFIIYPYDMNANSTRLPVSSLINNYYQIY